MRELFTIAILLVASPVMASTLPHWSRVFNGVDDAHNISGDPDAGVVTYITDVEFLIVQETEAVGDVPNYTFSSYRSFGETSEPVLLSTAGTTVAALDYSSRGVVEVAQGFDIETTTLPVVDGTVSGLELSLSVDRVSTGMSADRYAFTITGEFLQPVDVAFGDGAVYQVTTVPLVQREFLWFHGVPEPSALVLLTTAVACVAGRRR